MKQLKEISYNLLMFANARNKTRALQFRYASDRGVFFAGLFLRTNLINNYLVSDYTAIGLRNTLSDS